MNLLNYSLGNHNSMLNMKVFKAEKKVYWMSNHGKDCLRKVNSVWVILYESYPLSGVISGNKIQTKFENSESEILWKIWFSLNFDSPKNLIFRNYPYRWILETKSITRERQPVSFLEPKSRQNSKIRFWECRAASSMETKSV